MMKNSYIKPFLAGVFACLLIILFSGAARQEAQEVGRYQAVGGNNASSVFVLDTKTGALAKFYLDDFGTQDQVSAETVTKRLEEGRGKD